MAGLATVHIYVDTVVCVLMDVHMDVLLQPCKHDIFWFSYVSHLREECPICDASITGCGQINKTYTTNPFMSSASLIVDAKVREPTKESIPEHDDPSGGTPAGGTTMRKKAWDMIAMTAPREWCSDDQFSNGGVSSVQVEAAAASKP
jgi:hypothetical protein